MWNKVKKKSLLVKLSIPVKPSIFGIDLKITDYTIRGVTCRKYTTRSYGVIDWATEWPSDQINWYKSKIYY